MELGAVEQKKKKEEEELHKAWTRVQLRKLSVCAGHS
jgi:hypothetical protein